MAAGGGYANVNFRVTTPKGKYFVKFSQEHPAKALASEIAYVKHVTSASIPCPEFVAGHTGQHIFTNGATHAVVMTLLQGESHDILNDDQLAALGQVLAQVHTINTGTLVPRTTWWRRDYVRDGVRLAQKRFAHTGEFERIKECVANLAPLDFTTLPRSIVHGDPWPQNAVFKGEQLLALIDWEETTIGHCIFDFVYLAMSCCFTDDAFESENFRILLTAYESLRPLTIQERASVVNVAQRIACTNSLWQLLRCDAQTETLPATMAWYNGLDLAQLHSHV